MPKAWAELAAAKEQRYYSIGRAAELSGVTAKMIRHYEALELIPKAPRTMGDYRVYSAAGAQTLRFIRRARTLAQHCHGDARPECPILDDLGRLPRPD